MKENSIEEDIKNAEHFIKSIKTDKEYKEENGWHGYYNKEIVELARILQHILSDYKRLQEEFKAVDSECSRLERKEADMERENEELKATLRDTQNSWFEDTKKIEKLKAQNKELETQYLLQRDLINSNDYIAKKKIKDQLEHYQELQNNYIEKYDEISENIQSMINVLQVLLEESEEN